MPRFPRKREREDLTAPPPFGCRGGHLEGHDHLRRQRAEHGGEQEGHPRKREDRLVVRFDQASADFVNRTIDRRVERAKKFLKNPSLLSYRNCQDGKEYVRKAVFDDRTGEVIEARSVLELDEEKIAAERKAAGYMLYVTDIPREQDDLDGEFGKLKRLGYRVEYMDDREIAEIAGKRNDIEDCFRQMKSGLEARPVFVRKPEHIQAHLFTVYTALVLLMYLKKKYSLVLVLT